MKGSKVDMLPGLATTPRVMLEKMLERVDEIQHLVLIEQDKDGFVNIYTTEMTKGDAAWIKVEFDKRWM